MIKESCGYVLNGPEYLTILAEKQGKSYTLSLMRWQEEKLAHGDTYGNRADRFLACVAYLDGVHPSIVMCRGYYHKTTLVAYDFAKGELVKRWTHISDVEVKELMGRKSQLVSSRRGWRRL